MIELTKQDYGCYELVDDTTGSAIFYQSDWDRPQVAILFGWTPCPFCRSTDGSISCKHRTASAMINSATNFLDKNDGAILEHASITNGMLSL